MLNKRTIIMLCLGLLFSSSVMAAPSSIQSEVKTISVGKIKKAVNLVTVNLKDSNLEVRPVLAKDQIGATESLESMAKRSKAWAAMNMDGGASSGLYVNGKYLTQPGRLLSNAIVVVPKKPVAIRTKIDGYPLDFAQNPIILNNRVLVPLRGIFEALGATVEWNDSTRTIIAKKDDTTIVLPVGSTEAQINDQRISLEVPAQIKNGSTMVPARFIAEALGAKVEWDAAARTVIIYSNKMQ